MEGYRNISIVDFVLKLCNLEVAKYTFFSFLTNIPKERVLPFEGSKNNKKCDGISSLLIVLIQSCEI